jgi:hypothetical protein
MTSTRIPLTKTLEGYEATVGTRTFRIRPNLDPASDGRYIVTSGTGQGEYVGTVLRFAALRDVREYLAEVAAE